MKKYIYPECCVCGEKLTVTIDENGSCKGGHYWGELVDGEEHWECNGCFNR